MLSRVYPYGGDWRMSLCRLAMSGGRRRRSEAGEVGVRNVCRLWLLYIVLQQCQLTRKKVHSLGYLLLTIEL